MTAIWFILAAMTAAAVFALLWPMSRRRRQEAAGAELSTEAGEGRFVYRVEVCRSPGPTYGGRMIGNRDQYARLEVHLADGGQDYDVMGFTHGQLIDDVLDQYERHLEFVRLEQGAR